MVPGVTAKMVNRLCRGTGQHPNADTCAEHHGKLRKAVELRGLTGFAQHQLDRALAQRQSKANRDKERDCIHVPRAGIGIDGGSDRSQLRAPHDGPGDQQDGDYLFAKDDIGVVAFLKSGVSGVDIEYPQWRFDGHLS